MKNNIVHTKRNEVYTTSLIVAKMLDVPHKVLVNTIKRMLKKNNGNQLPLKYPQVFRESSFKNKMQREYVMYEMNEQAYMKLAMQLSNYEKAEKVQDMIIDAFSMMKTALLNKQNTSWLSARESGKLVRHDEMDIVQQFVEYATKQGSKSANNYYMNITKMTNKALELLIQVKDGKPIRDLANVTQLGFIQVVDNRAMQAIEYGMNENLPYKYIYQIAKEEVNKLVDSLAFNRIDN